MKTGFKIFVVRELCYNNDFRQSNINILVRCEFSLPAGALATNHPKGFKMLKFTGKPINQTKIHIRLEQKEKELKTKSPKEKKKKAK